jgi:hypothetical protein
MRASNLLWPALLAQNAIAITVDTTSAGKQLDSPVLKLLDLEILTDDIRQPH